MSYFAFVSAPVSETQPCGPDPEGDAGFENYLAVAEGKLPASFFDFKKSDFDLGSELQQIAGLLKQFRDIRLLVVAAKFSALAGSIARFSDAIIAMALLLQEHWEEVHPGGSETAYRHREAHISSLDDAPTVIVPLQYSGLVTDRRHGTVSYRSQLVASKVISARKGEASLDEAAIREALLQAEDFDGLKATLQTLVNTETALRQIGAQFAERSGPQTAPSFEKLASLLAGMTGFLTGVMQERDPSLAPAVTPVAEEAGPAPGETVAADIAVAVASAGAAAAALASIDSYFGLNEPSSPAVLLVRQARQLIGKSFIEAMVILNPALAEKASIKIGGEAPLVLSSAQMKALSGMKPAAGESAADPAVLPPIATRSQAEAFMEAVERHFQKTEPSSPIPMLLRRARGYSGKDFAALMKDVLG